MLELTTKKTRIDHSSEDDHRESRISSLPPTSPPHPPLLPPSQDESLFGPPARLQQMTGNRSWGGCSAPEMGATAKRKGLFKQFLDASKPIITCLQPDRSMIYAVALDVRGHNTNSGEAWNESGIRQTLHVIHRAP